MEKQSFSKQIFHQGRRWLAKFWLEVNPQLRIIGITGSFGKTSTTVSIAKVLAQKFPTIKTDINLDTVYNLPITLLKIKPWTEALVLEMGVDHPGEMDLHLSLVKPQIGVITGITPVHSDKEHLGSIEGIIKEKSKLLKCLAKDGLAVLNYDDENVRKLASLTKARVLFYGKTKDSDVWSNQVKVGKDGLSFDLHDQNKKIKVFTKLVGSHHVYTCMAAYLVGRYLGVSQEKYLKAMASLTPLSGRLSLEEGPLGTILVNDVRRANPVSTIAGLQTLADLPGKRKIAILGEMGELGSFNEEGHRLVGKKIVQLEIDFLLVIGPSTKFIIDEAVKSGFNKEKTFWVKDVVEAADVLRKIIKKGDLLYLKGSLLKHLERVILLLEGKQVNCYLVSCTLYQPCPTCPKLINNLK